MDLRKESIRFFGWWPWTILGGGFKVFLIFTPNPGEMIQFDVRIIFQMGWNQPPTSIETPFSVFCLGWLLIFRLETLSKLHLRSFRSSLVWDGCAVEELEIFVCEIGLRNHHHWVSFTSEIDDHHLWNLGEMVITQIIGGRQLPNCHWFRPLPGTSCRKSCNRFVMGISHYKKKIRRICKGTSKRKGCTIHLKIKICTNPKFNIAPERWWLEDYFPFGMVSFQGLC